jgi:hypothetical protein
MTAIRYPRLLTILAAVLTATLLGGCVDVTIESEYNEDGSARHSIQTTIDRDALEQLEESGGEGDTTFDPEEGREEAEAAGFDYTAIETDDEVGSRVSKSFDDGEDVTAAFDELFTATAEEDTPAPVGAVTGTFERDGDEYRLNLTIDSDVLFAGSTEGIEDTEDTPFGNAEDFFDIVYVATLPGEIIETNGEDLGNGKVEWELPLTGVTELTAVSEADNGGGGALIAIVGLVALLLIGALVAGFLFTRRRPPAPATSNPSVATYNTAPNTQPGGASHNPAPNTPPSGVTSNTTPGAPPSGSMGANAPPLARTDGPGKRPAHEQDTTRLP